MSASQNNLTLSINQQDSDGTNVINRLIGAISYDGVAGENRIGGPLPDTAVHALELPTPIILQFAFHNTHPTAVITLTGTVQGGASQVISKVQPGAVFVNWCKSTSGTAGYTALGVQGDITGATFEMYIGG